MGEVDVELLAGRYRMGELLGAGGVAQVHRAWDTRLGRPVAVKTFRHTPDPVDRMRFDNEVRTLATLSHPALVEVYDAGVDERRPYVVLQLIEGSTLRERIAEGPLTVAETRRLGSRLAEVLAYVHERGVTHRDVKPSNILLDEDGSPYLADFGVARLTGSERITASNQLVGTAAYLAPEQVRGTAVGTAADVYALGLVLLECLTGVPEYQGGDVESAVARLHRPPTVPPELPPDLIRLFSLMTALSPGRRPTAGECAAMLASAGSDDLGQNTRPHPAPLPWWAGSDDTRAMAAPPRRRAIAAAAAGLVAAAGAAVWLSAKPLEIFPPTTAIPVPSSSSVSSPQAGDGTAEPTTTTTPADPGPTDAAPPARIGGDDLGTTLVATGEENAGNPEKAGGRGNAGNAGNGNRGGGRDNRPEHAGAGAGSPPAPQAGAGNRGKPAR